MNSCPEGYNYRREFTVPGACVSNYKRSQLIDPRCPTGMHWRKEHVVKAKCVRKSKTRLKKQNQSVTTSTLASCDASIVQPIWEDHLKLILATVQQVKQLPIEPVTVNKIQRQFLKSVQKKLKAHNCEFRPTEEENLKLYNIIVNAAQNLAGDQVTEESVVSVAPVLSQLTSIENSVLDMDELYHLYFLFDLFEKLPNAKLTGRGRELLERYNHLFNQLAVLQREQKQATLIQYIKNYGESQLEPVSRQMLEAKYMGPFWTQDNVTVHCPHCNHLVQVTHYVPNTVIRCPFCQGNIRLE